MVGIQIKKILSKDVTKVPIQMDNLMWIQIQTKSYVSEYELGWNGTKRQTKLTWN